MEGSEPNDETEGTEEQSQGGETKRFEVSLLPAVTGALGDLLRPAAKEMGKYFQDRVRDWAQERRAKKQDENVRGHFEAVSDRIGSGKGFDTIAGAKALEAWTEGAQDVEPDDSALARIWQGLLLRIAKGDVDQDIALDVAKKMTSGDAKFINDFRKYTTSIILSMSLAFLQQSSEKHQYYYRRARQLGLIATDRAFIVISIYLILSCAMPFAALYLYNFKPSGEYPYVFARNLEDIVRMIRQNVDIDYVSPWFANLLLSFMLFLVTPTSRVSWIGKILLQSVPTVSKGPE